MVDRLRRTAAVLIALAWLLQLADAQLGMSGQIKTFTALDGAFRFTYPSGFQVCTRGKIEPCVQSYIPVCDQNALVCVVYPAKEFENTSFGAASFQVREIFKQEQMTPDVCVTPYPQKAGTSVSETPDFLISAGQPVEVIGGLRFIHGVNSEGGLGHSSSIDLYRVFHKQRCFELSVSQTGTTAASDPPMKTLTPAQQKKLNQIMSQILHTFRFSN